MSLEKIASGYTESGLLGRRSFIDYAKNLLLLLHHLKEEGDDDDVSLLLNTLSLIAPTNFGSGLGNVLDLLYREFTQKGMYGNMEEYAKEASVSVYDLIQRLNTTGSHSKPPSPKK